jgi:hypothetical protein
MRLFEKRIEIIPDYTVAAEKVFAGATALILRHANTLDYLWDTRHRIY